MNDTAMRTYCAWARRELTEGVGTRCLRYGILQENSPAPDEQAVGGRVLSNEERRQRGELLRLAAAEGWDALVERAAYTWFNRLVAIRYMEANDRLPSHVRVLSASDGSFAPQALAEALDLELPGLPPEEVARLVGAGDDEALFRRIFLAQCDELADAMPAVFEHVGGALELLLPDGLLRRGSVVERLVDDIPEDDWREGVQIVGWAYQYYVAERKDEVFAGFKRGKKADRMSLGPATQLFTPDWIVRYLTQNSLGRLWVLGHPESALPEEMEYFVRPDEGHETGFRQVESPEDLRVVDPACGSGHILVYAFDLLMRMYAEAGYATRDAARLVVEKNLRGLEIDPRAAALASFALTMKACEYDARFLRRGVAPQVTVLARVELAPEELSLCPHVAARAGLVDAAAHLDECGSLARPTADDLAALDADLAGLAGAGSLFAGSARDKLGRLHAELAPLAERYDVVVANPPYMGSKNMGPWLAKWVKKNYPDEARDLCTCFIERGFGLADDTGYSAMVTMESWMFLGSFEKMRAELLSRHTIVSMVYMNHMVMKIAFNTCATVFCNAHVDMQGVYTQVYFKDIGEDGKPVSFPSRRDSEGDYFYRADAANFSAIPGTPIAYWASDALLDAFRTFPSLKDIAAPRQGLATGDNDRFLRLWWEVPHANIGFGMASREEAQASGLRWFPCQKGGGFRRWYGNNEYVVNWQNDGEEMREFGGSVIRNPDYYFREGMTWGMVSSSELSMRYFPTGHIFTNAGLACFAEHKQLLSLLAAVNCAANGIFIRFLAPTMNFSNGDVGRLPVSATADPAAEDEVHQCISLSRADWDSHETSWDFKRHPLV